MRQPLFSVVVPVYKTQEAMLRKCFDSLVQQDCRDLEIIAVEDGSPDGCGLICDEYSRRYGNFLVIHKENGGVSSARNTGLDAATGKYIAFCDADDYVESDLFSRLEEVVKSDESLDLVLFRFVQERPDGTLLEEPPKPTDTPLPSSFDAALYVAAAQEYLIGIQGLLYEVPWGKIWRRAYLLEHNLRFPEGIAFREDNIFAINALSFDPNASLLDYAAYHWVIHQESATRHFKYAEMLYPATLNRMRKDICSYYQGEQRDCLLEATNSMAKVLLREGAAVSFEHPDSTYSMKQAAEIYRQLDEGLGRPYAGTCSRDLSGKREKLLGSLLRNRHYKSAILAPKAWQRLKQLIRRS